MTEAVLDASALLALLNDEPGSQTVGAALPEAIMSTVNLSEVVGKLAEQGIEEDVVRRLIDGLGLTMIAFDEDQAYAAGMLRPGTLRTGLSLGDRACLALARRRKASAFTTDRAWLKAQAGVKVRVIR